MNADVLTTRVAGGKLCITEPALARLHSYEEANISSPSRSIVVEQGE